MLTRLYDLLSSWRLSVVLMVSGALYYIFLAIWGARSPAQVVQTIAGMSPFILLYVLLLTNTLFCFLRRIRGYLTLLSPSAVFLPSVAQWIHFFPDVPPLSDIPELEGETRVQIRNRFAPLGTLLLHGSLFILATGFLLSHLTRFEGKFSAGQGESLSVGPGNYDSLSPPAPLRRSLPAF
mgnify:FL=1